MCDWLCVERKGKGIYLTKNNNNNSNNHEAWPLRKGEKEKSGVLLGWNGLLKNPNPFRVGDELDRELVCEHIYFCDACKNFNFFFFWGGK